ncbi:MAG: triose-phosphate isomerase [Lachnospiraceae bacterium]|nr:triose-phosphate isomerase [Lachnospiraceae bacterium]
MKHLFLNLKRFDIPAVLGGVNHIADIRQWGKFIVEQTQKQLKVYAEEEAEFVMYFPEAHLIPAVSALEEGSPIQIGCQSVFRQDTAVGGNFGAFTTSRTGNAMKAIGCTSTIIGHCEERRDRAGILSEAGVSDNHAVNRILNQEIKAALDAGLSVLYCIGENAQEQDRWQEVLKEQLDSGLCGVDRSKVILAYEPIWAIGPGKIPPDQEYITKIGSYVKEITDGMEIVYGGGLKKENAKMLASISVMDGGLIALTRFQGQIGFYPEEYLEIIREYLE